MQKQTENRAQSRQSSHWMTKRYALALFVIAILAGTAYVALTLVIENQESTGAVVNISGRQRMLSQRTTLFVQRMLLARDLQEYEHSRNKLKQATDLIELSHNGLTRGNEKLGLPSTMSGRVASMYFEGEMALDPRMRRFIQALRTVLAAPYGKLKTDDPAVQHIQSTAPGPLLISLDKMVWQYQREGEAIIENLKLMETGVFALTLITLFLEVVLIFRPMVRQVVNQMEQLKQVSQNLNQEVDQHAIARGALQKSRDELELRVAERTSELTREIADRKKVELDLRESEQRFRAVSETAIEAIITLDHEGTIVGWNKGATNIFHYKEQEVLGQSAELLMPEEFRLLHRNGINRYSQEGGPSKIINATIVQEGVRKGGKRFPIELSVSSWYSRGKTFYTSILRDISDRKEYEQALFAAKEQAESATLAKSRFLATMSHEIRTPMNAIIGMTELLKDTQLSENQAWFVQTLNRSGEILLTLINDILDLSKIEAGSFHLENAPFNLHDSFNETSQLLTFSALDKGIGMDYYIDPTVPLWVYGDQARLRQILLNLIGNAIKFTQKGKVSVLVTQEADDRVKFSIRDTGPGIPKDKQEEIFKPFTQADPSTTRKYGGTGLGLTICRHLVNLMQGDLAVESEPGKGALFYFTLPFVAVDEREISPHRQEDDRQSEGQEPQGDGQDMTILLVEDTEENQRVIQGYLGPTEYQVDIAENGQVAVDKFMAGNYDLVLMDIQMPVMDGYEATRTMRSWELENGIRPIPIIALTAHALREEREKIKKVGCDYHLTKPIRKARLLKILRQFRLS